MKHEAQTSQRERASIAGEAPDLIAGLLPCPFCGNEAVLVTSVDSPEEQRAFCGLAACSAFYQKFATLEQWNRRTDKWQPIETVPKDGTVRSRQ